MYHWRRLLVPLFCLLVLTGCSKPKAATPVQLPPSPTAPEAAPLTKEQLNDLAFTHMQAKNWPEAIKAAEQAVKLDPGYAPARFNLGASLYRAERYQEALPHLQAAYDLNKKQVEPGWYLALTYEKLGDTARAIAIFQELAPRFPEDPDVKQALGRLKAGVPVTWTIPNNLHSWRFTGDKVLVEIPTGLEATGPDGAPLWAFKADGANGGVMYNDNLTLAIFASDKGGQVIDLQTGNRMGSTPRLEVGKGAVLSWRGDIIMQSYDVRAVVSPGGNSSYMHTVHEVYRLSRSGNTVEFHAVMPHIEAGRQGSASATGVLLIPAAYEDEATFYRDGKSTGAIKARANNDAAVAITGAGDFAYRLSSTGELSAYDVTGRQLWQEKAVGNRIHEWHRGKETWLAVTQAVGNGSYKAFDARGRLVTSGEGYVTASSSRHLVVTSQSECLLVNEAGQVAARYPYTAGSACGITPDGAWVYTAKPGTLTAYRVIP